MWPRTLARFALAVALGLTVGAGARGQDETGQPATPEPADENGFSWLCFGVAVTALGGLYVVVRRRERAIEADQRNGHRAATDWYCRRCDRDVSGPACPACGAANPFLNDPASTRPARMASRPGKGRLGERRQ